METLVTALAFILAFTFGACIGSFLNVVVYRLPAGISLIYPPSRCPKCEHSLGGHRKCSRIRLVVAKRALSVVQN